MPKVRDSHVVTLSLSRDASPSSTAYALPGATKQQKFLQAFWGRWHDLHRKILYWKGFSLSDTTWSDGIMLHTLYLDLPLG